MIRVIGMLLLKRDACVPCSGWRVAEAALGVAQRVWQTRLATLGSSLLAHSAKALAGDPPKKGAACARLVETMAALLTGASSGSLCQPG